MESERKKMARERAEAEAAGVMLPNVKLRPSGDESKD